jgi:hypothetical protein
VSNRIPILAIDIAREYDCLNVVVVAWGGDRTHVLVHGKAAEDCGQASLYRPGSVAHVSNEPPNDETSRVKKLIARIKDLGAELASELTK